MGYTGGITIIKDYVKPFRPARNAPAVRRYETPPGKLATAILDRLLHHAHIINIRGDSYRLKSRIKAGNY
jgi:transposase